MRASELLGRPVLDATGTALGIVHDLQVRLPADAADAAEAPEADTADADASTHPTVVRLVVGPDDFRCRLAYSWGYAQSRSRGPALLRVLLAGQGSRARAVAVGDVISWDHDGHVRVRGGAS